MSHIRRIACFLFCMLLVPLSVRTEQITKVGIVDTVKVYSAFFRQSREVRMLEQRIADFQEEVGRLQEELLQLETAKLEADEQESEVLSLELSEKIFEKKQYLGTYIRVNQDRLRNLRDNLTQSNQFYEEVFEVIQYIAEHEGFTLILTRNLDEIIFHTKEIDITDIVIEELMRRVKQ